MTTTLRLSATAAVTSAATTAAPWTPDYSRPQDVEVRAEVADLETAQAIAALFPKSVGFRAATISRPAERAHLGSGYLSFRANLLKNGTTGERNESGLKRLARLLAVAEKNGLAIEWEAPYVNSYPTREAFEAAAL